MIELKDTNSAAIAAQFLKERTDAGSPVMGMVMTMVIVVPKEHAAQAIADARKASHEHPARVLAIILGDKRGAPHVNAVVGTGQDGWTGEVAMIELTGPVVNHVASVVLPLLLPDSPVVVWWPIDPPARPGEDPLGSMALRRITDAAATTKAQTRVLRIQCEGYTAGNTDLAWARTTSWRALLASALDQHQVGITSAEVTADSTSPAAMLMRGWLNMCLKVPVTRKVSDGPGITKVVLHTKAGDISIERADVDKMATFTAPGRPPVPIALKRRSVAECLAEELRRLDEDDVYRDTVRHLAKMLDAERPKKKAKKAGSR